MILISGALSNDDTEIKSAPVTDSLFTPESVVKLTEENQNLRDLANLSEEKIIERLSSRRMCSKCNQPTSLDWMVDGKCEKCGGDVYTRDDDKPEVIKVRLQKQAVPLEVIEFYKEKGVFSKVDATDQVEDTYALVKTVLDSKNND